MKCSLSLAVLAALLVAKSVWAETRNPDRWPTIDLSLNGTSSFKGDEIAYQNGGPDIEQNQRNLNLAGTALTILPVSDAWTLLASFGGNWTEALYESLSAPAETSIDNTLVTYMLGARRYFLDRHVLSGDPSENPDRWPSVGLTAGASTSLNYTSSNAVVVLPKNQSTQNEVLTLDTRLPLSNPLTLTLAAGVNRLYSQVPGTATTDSTKTVESDIIPSIGFRYFFVGQNFILQDHNQNPDRWTMISLVLTGTGEVYAHTTIRGPLGREGERGKGTRVYTATTQARVPITDHMSLHFDFTGNYSRFTEGYMTSPSHDGYLSRLGTLGFGAGLRYFFF